jgi:translation initiation factor IF-1
MAREDAISVEGIVIEALPNKTYRVELANGHRLLAFIAGRARFNFVQVAVGERVALELSPYDLSKGRIVTEMMKTTS